MAGHVALSAEPTPLCGERTRKRYAPLPSPRFARLGSLPALTRPFQIQVWKAWDGTTVTLLLMAAPVSVAPAGPAGRNGPRMAGADPSVLVGPTPDLDADGACGPPEK